MNNVAELMLGKIGTFWNAAYRGDIEETLCVGQEILDDYSELVLSGDDYIAILDDYLEDATDMYILTISVLYFLSKDSRLLKKVETLICKEELDVFLSLSLQFNVENQRFMRGFESEGYVWERKIHKSLVNLLKKRIDFGHVWEKTVKKGRIILTTDTFMVEDAKNRGRHAPTEMVEKFYAVLRYQLGYEVMLLVLPYDDKESKAEDYWFDSYIRNYFEKNNGDFEIQYKGMQVEGYQQPIGEKYIPDIYRMLEKAADWQPEFIFHIGGENVMLEILSDIAPAIAMPCTMGYAVSEVPYLISYMGKESVSAKEAMEYLKLTGQKAYYLTLPSEPQNLKKHFRKSDFGYGEEDFVIAVMGNRLETEIDDAFLELMEVLVEEKNCYFCLIGKYEKEIYPDNLREHVRCLGYRTDFNEVLAMTDLFLNPKRQGAAGGAAVAMLVGVPTVTLPDCDVASAVGNDFVCNSYDEMRSLVSRYMQDKDFYTSQVEICRQQSEKSYGIDLKSEIEHVFDQIRKEAYR